MSDPADAGQEATTLHVKLIESSTTALPTFARFPTESNEKNCWSTPPLNTFHVRGPMYLQDKKKVASGPYLLTTRGCDLFLTTKPPVNIGR